MMLIASTGLRQQLYASVKTLHGWLGRSLTRHPALMRLEMTSVWDIPKPLGPNLCLRVSTQNYKILQNSLGVYNSKLLPSGSWKRALSSSRHAFGNSEGNSISNNEQTHGRREHGDSFFANIVQSLVKALGMLLLAAILLAAALPSLLSWSPGRRAAVSLANKFIPGNLNISSMSLGWTQPLHVEGFSLQGTDGESVLLIAKVATKAPLWSIVLRKSGLGDCTVTSPVIDLQQHHKHNLPRLALAVTSAEKLLAHSPRARKAGKQAPVPPADASLTVEVKAPNGGLEVINGKIIFPSDVASVLGDRLFINVGVGSWATKESDELKRAEDQNGGVPVLACLWSESVQAEAAGFIRSAGKQFKLIKPMKVEMDLTPGVAKFYLARVNPVLGEIVGPAIKDEDMPDVIVQISPTNLELPADHYKINIAPMKVTLARGQVVDGILSLLSKQELAKGSRNLTMQTSAIEAKVDMPSSVRSSRLDILIADRVHVATWGNLDWIDETVQMVLAIPGKSLRDVLGLTKVPANYYLKIPVTGTLDKPKVDWRAAGIGIAELTARQRGGQLIQGIFDIFDSNDKSKADIPEPIDTLPWEKPSAS